MTTINIFEESGLASQFLVQIVKEVPRHNLREFLEDEKARSNNGVIIWRDNKEVVTCETEGCNGIVEVRGPCDLCPRCLDPDPYGMNCAIGPCHACEPLTRAKCLNDNGN